MDKEKNIKQSGPMNKGGKIIEKPKNFRVTFKRLVKYIGSYNKWIVTVMILLILGTILSVMSPKILGYATTELAKNIMSKMVYNEINKSLDKIPENIKSNLNEDATVRDLEVLNILPKEITSKLTDEMRDIKLFKEPKINFKYIEKILLIILGIYVISAIFTYIANRTMAHISNKVTFKLRNEVDEKLSRLPLKYYDKNTHGEILSKVTNDIDNINTTLQQALVQIIQAVLTIIGIIVMMLTISISITGVAALMIPTALILIASIVKKSQKYFIANQKVLGQINGHIEETYSLDIVVKAFNMEDEEIKIFDEYNNSLALQGRKSQFLSGLMMPIVGMINHLGYIAICILGAKFAIEGKITIGNIQAFLQYVNQFQQPLSQSANMFSIIQGTIASAERVFEILDEKEQSDNPKKTIRIKNVKGNVEFDNVCFGYEENQKLIKNWSLKANAGQTIAIVGPTGSGKTTMVNLLMKFYDIDSGDIKIDDVSIKDMTREDVRKIFSMVLQDTWLFSGTIRENLKYAKQKATNKEIEEAAKLAHAHHFIEALPNGYDFVINEEANNISDGQKQLLTIARAVLSDSKVLILDEATSNVDTRTEELIQKAMNKLMEGRTSFVIAHRLSTIKNADKIVVMNSGEIIEQGKHNQLLKQDGYYAKLYNSQFNED